MQRKKEFTTIKEFDKEKRVYHYQEIDQGKKNLPLSRNLPRKKEFTTIKESTQGKKSLPLSRNLPKEKKSLPLSLFLRRQHTDVACRGKQIALMECQYDRWPPHAINTIMGNVAQWLQRRHSNPKTLGSIDPLAGSG